MKHRITALATYTLATLLLTGCIGDDDNDVAGTTALTSSTTRRPAATTGTSPTTAQPAATGTGTTPPTSAAGTKSVVVNWAAPTEYEDGSPFIDLAGYRIWYGKTPGSYQSLIDVAPGTTSYKVHSLAASTYYFSITAYNHDGAESTLSNEIMIKLN